MKFNFKYISLVDFTMKVSLTVALICSFYTLVDVLIFDNENHKKTFTAWQFPMIFAILIDLYLMN